MPRNQEISNHIDDLEYIENGIEIKYKTAESETLLQELEPETTEEAKKGYNAITQQIMPTRPHFYIAPKKHINPLLLPIKTIVNKYLIKPVVPCNLKHALLHSALGLDQEMLKDYRPIQTFHFFLRLEKRQ